MNWNFRSYCGKFIMGFDLSAEDVHGKMFAGDDEFLLLLNGKGLKYVLINIGGLAPTTDSEIIVYILNSYSCSFSRLHVNL